MTHSSRARSARLVAAILATFALLAALGQPVQAATPRPGGLGASSVATAPVLKWQSVRGATSYRVELSASKSFGTLLWSTVTTNVRATPTLVLPLGKVYWRVQAVGSNGMSRWTTASFTRAARSGPTLVGPADGVTLEQPESPPVLRWDPVPGARSYEIELDGEERDWVDVETYSTKTTALVVDEPQPNGSYWWRVRAVMASGVNTRFSDERAYAIGPLRTVTLGETADTMEEVVLEWDPVPGAVAYEIRVSTDNGFNTITDQRIVSGTRYSPTTTYNNASYWWQVRAVNALGQSEEWPIYPQRTGEFRRNWLVAPDLVHPANAANITDDLYFQWSPVRLASTYTLDIGTDPGFSNNALFKSCQTTQTTFTAYYTSAVGNDTCVPKLAGTYYWRVRAQDLPAPVSGVNSLFSEVRSFTLPAPPTGGGTGPAPLVTGQRLTLEGNGPAPCTKSLATSEVCSGVTSTPVFDWDPAPGAVGYRIYLSHDRELTNLVQGYGNSGSPNTLPWTTNTRWAPPRALPDTQAGEAYYWFIRACMPDLTCGLQPEQATNAFQKKSAPVELVSPLHGAVEADQVTFVWTDYLETNQATTDPSTGEHPTQAAKQYRLQVSDTESFAKIVDDVKVDQTTYTAFAKAYPEGLLWWRVQAIDGSNNALTWSEARSFTKASPTPTVVGPTGGEVVRGVQPFRWEPLDYAKYYDLEVYRNNDRTASAVNKAAWATNVRQTAFAFKEPLEALGQDFVWRIRRTDYSGNRSAWGPWHAFRVGAATPTLVSPKSGARVNGRTAFFTWRATAEATSYAIDLRSAAGTTVRVTTVGTAYAPTSALARGKWTWRVSALDTMNRVLRTTGWRAVRVR